MTEKHNQVRPLFERIVRIGDFDYRLASDDDYLNHIGSDFEPNMCRLFKSLIEKDFRVFDVGANIGCTSLLFASLAAHVDSFEPSPTTFKMLQRNIQASPHANVKLHNHGLGLNNETLTLTFSPSNRSGAFVSDLTQASEGHSIETVEIRKGDDLFLEVPVDFMKIDVEGYEKNVITGLEGVIKRNRPTVVLELNHWCLNAFQRVSIPDFFDFLMEIFPIIYAVDGERYLDLHDPSHRYHVMYHHIIHFRYQNLIAAFEPNQVDNFKTRFVRGV